MILVLPLTVPVSKNSKFILNLNNYRNAHFLVLSKAKANYSHAVAMMLPEWNRMKYKVAYLVNEYEAGLKKARKSKGEAAAQQYEAEQKPALDHKINQLEAKYADYPAIRFTDPVRLTFTYYHGNSRLVDVSNPCSIIDKFTCDALTQAAVWGDDHAGIVLSSSYRFGGVDKAEPRCVLTIERDQ